MFLIFFYFSVMKKKIDFQLCFMYQHSVNIKRWPHNHRYFFPHFYTFINKSSKFKIFLHMWHHWNGNKGQRWTTIFLCRLKDKLYNDCATPNYKYEQNEIRCYGDKNRNVLFGKKNDNFYDVFKGVDFKMIFSCKKKSIAVCNNVLTYI